MTAVPRFLVIFGFLTTIQNAVDAFLGFPLPKKCDFSIYCNFTSRFGDTLTTSDFMYYPTLRILHDLQVNSTIMKEYKGRTGFSPRTNQMLRVHVNGYVYSRTPFSVVGCVLVHSFGTLFRCFWVAKNVAFWKARIKTKFVFANTKTP